MKANEPKRKGIYKFTNNRYYSGMCDDVVFRVKRKVNNGVNRYWITIMLNNCNCCPMGQRRKLYWGNGDRYTKL